MIKFYCRECEKKIGVPDEQAGRRVKCPKCGDVCRVPKHAAKKQLEMNTYKPEKREKPQERDDDDLSETFAALINMTRQTFPPPPRKFGFLEKRYIDTTPPAWCSLNDDPLMLNYTNRKALTQEGMVVWAAVVQANQIMFEPGKGDAPGTVIFSPDVNWSDRLEPLLDVARKLFDVKGEAHSDPEAQRYGEMLADEYERAMWTTVPQCFTGDHEVISSSVIYFRKHLPGGFLANGFYPMLIHPPTRSCMVLPERYWPEPLLRGWLN